MFREQKRYGIGDPNVVMRSKTTFNDPLKWKDPSLIFTCSWSDWFIEEADPWRDEAWDIIDKTNHTYQILTKRPERIIKSLPKFGIPGNVWLGITAENQESYDERVWYMKELADRKFKKHWHTFFISAEPLLGPIDFGKDIEVFDWIITGCESGPGHREMKEEWALDIQSQCRHGNVSLFHKQQFIGGKLVKEPGLGGVPAVAFPKGGEKFSVGRYK